MKGRGTYHQSPSDIAAESASAKQETPGGGDFVEVEGGEDAPAHELEVEIDGLARESGGIHHGSEVGDAGHELSLGILLPSEGRRAGGGGGCGVREGDEAKEGLPDAVRGGIEVAPAEDAKGGGGIGVEGPEVGEEVAEGPARVCGVGRGIDEGDGLVFWRDRGEKGGIVLDGGDGGSVDEKVGLEGGAGAEGGEDGGQLRGG